MTIRIDASVPGYIRERAAHRDNRASTTGRTQDQGSSTTMRAKSPKHEDQPNSYLTSSSGVVHARLMSHIHQY